MPPPILGSAHNGTILNSIQVTSMYRPLPSIGCVELGTSVDDCGRDQETPSLFPRRIRHFADSVLLCVLCWSPHQNADCSFPPSTSQLHPYNPRHLHKSTHTVDAQ